jgi:FtsP/CotA-like multicopper oxidase with cupredoxin domain
VPKNITYGGAGPFLRYHVEGIGPQWQNVTGMGSVVVKESDPEYRVIYDNQLPVETTMHQHGQTPPVNLDGVPYLSQVPILPGRAAITAFNVYPQNRGSYFIHSHYGYIHAKGLTAPMIMQGPWPAGFPEKETYDATNVVEAVMFLEDFCPYASDDPTTNPKCDQPASVFAALTEGWEGEKEGWDFDACMEAGTGGDVMYRYQLANDRVASEPVVQTVAAGDVVRLRLINSAGMSNYKIVFPPNLDCTLVAVDGQFLHPQPLSQLPGNSASCAEPGTPAEGKPNACQDAANAEGPLGTPADGFWLAVAQRADFMCTMPALAGAEFKDYPFFARSDAPVGPHLQVRTT